MPIADDGARLDRGRREIADPGEAERGKQRNQGHNGVNRDAQRTAIGIAAGSVVVRNLDNSQQSQQDQTHYGRHP